MCSFLQLVGDKWGKSGPRGWCVIPRDDPLVLYVYAAPQVMPPRAPSATHTVLCGEWDWGEYYCPICRMNKPRPNEDMILLSLRVIGFQSWAQAPGHNCFALRGQLLSSLMLLCQPAPLRGCFGEWEMGEWLLPSKCLGAEWEVNGPPLSFPLPGHASSHLHPTAGLPGDHWAPGRPLGLPAAAVRPALHLPG